MAVTKINENFPCLKPTTKINFPFPLEDFNFVVLLHIYEFEEGIPKGGVEWKKGGGSGTQSPQHQSRDFLVWKMIKEKTK
jgi:hypothetical protein